ncbi:5-oxoprolinase/urea amidolyase family protein [Xenorhabdus hominickii]|uniref:Allophanate hydrolase n=1 Tax=Xenorhabdus hominickii TaxID=351679 RepID=A0A2G0QFS4_XENHO|nr:5-oxoprolinase/urea amidolyase family protein [Xenorhabdus hominickii]AOM42084.1 allophanate hydrolase [Xenorhabdus hominickii]PHM58080.1 putative multifunctional urea amidolyase [Xenorhabdus hominickii]
MHFLPVNCNTIMVELSGLAETLALLDSLNMSPILGIEEIIPAAKTLMIRFRPTKISTRQLVAEISSRDLQERGYAMGKRIEIPVHYNGDDLALVAEILGCTVQEVIHQHTENEYTVAFTGFAPGFAYMASNASQWNIPRREIPRTRIPAGAVALAGEFSSIYPQASPGGWQIIGMTTERMWDLSRSSPALLQPGYRVNFRNVGQRPTTVSLPETSIKNTISAPETACYLEILSVGLQTLFQDLGRLGQSGLGISESGAMDKSALRSANRIVGNASDQACLEIVQGGFKAMVHGQTLIAITGASCPIKIKTTSGEIFHVSTYQPIDLNDGDEISLGTPDAGMRSYLAVRGGFVVPSVLSSHSFDTLSNIGPAPLKVRDKLTIGETAYYTAVSFSETPAFAMPDKDDVVVLDIIFGPRTDWFTQEALELLLKQIWQVTPQSNRIGLRLNGECSLSRTKQQELPSEGTCIGAIQIPASGQPVLFLADHPLTGGYPVIASVADYHLDLAGQIPINAKIRFNPIRPFLEIQGSKELL